MTQTVSATPGSSRVALALAVTFAALLAVTGALWAYYGTTVFFETVRTGWMACF